MEDWASGFRIDEAFHTWGTRFDSVVPGCVETGYASLELPCRSAYGFATVYAEPTAPRPDRPVTTVAYELADTGTAPRYLFAELVKRLGPPDDISRDDAPEQANENAVVLHANWKRDRVAIGLSLYGAPRPSDFGNGLGKLYLSWAERDAAVAPFLAEWIRGQSGRGRRRRGRPHQDLLRPIRDLRGLYGTSAGGVTRPVDAGAAADAAGDCRAPRTDDFRPVERCRQLALVPLDRPHHRAAGG